jgi:hypothetical protein
MRIYVPIPYTYYSSPEWLSGIGESLKAAATAEEENGRMPYSFLSGHTPLTPSQEGGLFIKWCPQ